MSPATTAWPKGVKVSAVSTAMRPVTHTALVEVNQRVHPGDRHALPDGDRQLEHCRAQQNDEREAPRNDARRRLLLQVI